MKRQPAKRMWPYVRKTPLPYRTTTIQLHGNGYRQLHRNYSTLDREYYRQLTMSAISRTGGFQTNTVADDGRVLRKFGSSTEDVTAKFIDKVKSAKTDYPDKHLHNRNVSQLKAALEMTPDSSSSLTYVAGAIMNNDVVPPLPLLENNALLLAKNRKHRPQFKLPPLGRRRLSLERFSRIEQVATEAAPVRDRRYSFTYRQHVPTEAIPEQSTEFPKIQRKTSVGNSDHFDLATIENSAGMNWNTGGFKRRPSFGANVRLRVNAAGSLHQDAQGNSSSDKRYGNGILRKDSVTRISENIHDQFWNVLQGKRKSLDTNSTTGVVNLGLSLATNVEQPHESIVKQVPTDQSRSLTRGYRLRHEYGKNLERNWFRNEYMKRHDRRKSLRSEVKTGYDLRLDIFYSPDQPSDTDIDNSDDSNNDLEDESSMHCSGFSTVTAEYKSRQRLSSIKLQQTMLPLETQYEDDTDKRGESSESEYEIVLKDNQLIQRRTKHKMQKKRKRQSERYKAFMPPEEDGKVVGMPDGNVVPLTDQEIRALRLNLRSKEHQRKLKGKRKFLQAANAVFVAVQFRKILQQVRRRKKMLLKKRQRRLAKMVAKRLKAKLDKEAEKEEQAVPRAPGLKDLFLQEMGQKLIYDVHRLNINTDQCDDQSNDDSEAGDYKDDTNQNQQPQTKPSKFEVELRKISVSDLNGVSDGIKKRRKKHKRHRKRRNSFPKLTKPSDFWIEVPERSRRKRVIKKTVAKEPQPRRPQTPPSHRCSCFRHTAAIQSILTSQSSTTKPCTHQQDARKRKMKMVCVPTRGLMRTHSLENLAKKRPIDLADVLKDVYIPAKEIKLQILARKFRRQKRKRKQIRLSPVPLPERPLRVQPPPLEEVKSETEEESSSSDDLSQESDYEFVYGGPFVGSGVMWNKNTRDKKPTWTEEDVNREMKRITRVFHEMKECRYLRLDSFNDAMRKRLNSDQQLI